MDRRFERTISQILTLIVLVVFVTTIISANFNIWAVSYIWAVTFLLAWALMLVYGLHVLLQSESYSFSIIVAILTAIAFCILSVPAILVLARFLPGLPVGLTFGVNFLDANSQFVLYTLLIVVYFTHLINAAKLRNNNEEYSELVNIDEVEEDNDFIEIESANDDDKIIVYTEEESLETNDVSNDSIGSIDNSEKIIFESNIDKKLEYNTEEVTIVEDLTEEELKQMEGEEEDG